MILSGVLWCGQRNSIANSRCSGWTCHSTYQGHSCTESASPCRIQGRYMPEPKRSPKDIGSTVRWRSRCRCSERSEGTEVTCRVEASERMVWFPSLLASRGRCVSQVLSRDGEQSADESAVLLTDPICSLRCRRPVVARSFALPRGHLDPVQ